jgi:hypothetical protein
VCFPPPERALAFVQYELLRVHRTGLALSDALRPGRLRHWWACAPAPASRACSERRGATGPSHVAGGGTYNDLVKRPPKKKRAASRAVAHAGAGLPAGYITFLDDVKARIRAAQVKAALAVNAELVLLYWSLGRDIVARQRKEGWGAQVIDRLSADLRAAFPDMQGLSPPESEVHACVRRSVARSEDCATGRCTIAVGSQRQAPRPLEEP